MCFISHFLLLVDPNFELEDCLAPFQPLNCQIYHCPIDPRLDHRETEQLINAIQPKQVIQLVDSDALIQKKVNKTKNGENKGKYINGSVLLHLGNFKILKKFNYLAFFFISLI